MKTAYFRFYGGLKDLLNCEHYRGEVLHDFNGRQTVKDRIESLGVPHTEVDLILKESEAVDFSYLVKAEDRMSIYPFWQYIEVPEEIRLQPPAPEPLKFVLDAHLGKLASYLRIMGFDSLYSNDFDDLELARIQEENKRVLLTRDKGLLKRKRVKWGSLIYSDSPRVQLREVLARYDVYDEIDEFGRCPECNQTLEVVDKSEIIERLEPLTKKYFQFFKMCSGCEKIYWRGSHYDRIKDLIEKVRS